MKNIEELYNELEIKCKEEWIKKNVYSGKIKTIKIGEDFFIDEKEYINISRLRKSGLAIDLVIPEGYLTRLEVVSRYNFSVAMLSYINTINLESENKRIKFYSEKSAEELFEKKEEIDRYEKSEEWINLAKFHKDRFSYNTFGRMRRKNEVKKEYVKEFILGAKKIIFIKRKFYEDISAGVYKVDRSKERGPYNTEALLYEDIDCILKKVVAKKKDEIDKFLNEEGYYNLYDVVHVSGLSLRTLNKAYKNVKKDIDFKEHLFNKKLYVNLYILELILINYAKRTVDRIDDYNYILKERLVYFPKDNIETYEAAAKFLRAEASNEALVKRELIRKISSIENFISILEDELFMLDSNKIINSILNVEKVGQWPIICKFVNYARNHCFNNARYTKQFGMTLLKQYENEGKKENNDIYDKKTWSKYYLNLNDIDKHYVKAIEKDTYAQMWLYCLLNLSVTWRKKDILKSVPNIYLEELGIMGFEWFDKDNEFTLDMAQDVINQIKLSLDGVIASKNKRNLHFNIPLSLKIATAISFIICEIHRRKNNEDILLYKLITKNLTTKNYSLLFGGDLDLINFSNLRCTRSIISYGYSYAAGKIGSSALAYKFGVINRSHVNKVSKTTNTTEDYMRLTTLESGATEYMLHIIQRESFGFMYYKIFQGMIKEEFNSLTQDEVTDIIKSIKEKISPLTLENISTKLINNSEINKLNIFDLLWLNSIKQMKDKSPIKVSNYNDSEWLINLYKEEANELFGDNKIYNKFLEDRFLKMESSFKELSEKNIKSIQIAENIFNGLNSAYSEKANCIFDDIEKDIYCPYKGRGTGVSSCIGCIYCLNTTYVLYEIAEKLNVILTELEKYDNRDQNELTRNSYLVKLYLSIIIEAKVHFKDQKSYIEKIVDLKMIKKRICNLIEIDRLNNFI